MNPIENIRQRLKKELQSSQKARRVTMGSVDMESPEIPKISESKNQDHIIFGEDNLYPQFLADLKYGSSIHNAIISTVADMINGNGFLISDAKTLDESQKKAEGLPADQKAKWDAFLLNAADTMTTLEVKEKISFDFKEQGACAFEVIFSQDFSAVARIKYVDVKNLRAGKKVNGVIKTWWYSNDWANIKKTENRPKSIPAVDYKSTKNPKNSDRSLNQIVYIKRGSLKYYGEPDYVGALTWIQTDFQMGIFHLSNIQNGMNPSMAINFYEKPATAEEQQTILDEIKKRWAGPKRTGKHMVFFSDGKDLAPAINPVQTSNLDKQLLNMAELCDRKILTGHKLTSPLLAGISTSGQIGGNVEMETAYKIFDSTRVAPYRNSIDLEFNKIIAYNGIPFRIRTNLFSPFYTETKIDSNPTNSALSALSPLVANKVLELMSTDEIRALIALPPSNQPAATNPS